MPVQNLKSMGQAEGGKNVLQDLNMPYPQVKNNEPYKKSFNEEG